MRRILCATLAAALLALAGTTPLHAQSAPLKIWQKSYQFAVEGTYFCATNPTPGTGIATIAAPTTLADTSPFWIVKNNNTQTSNKYIYLDYLKMIVTAAGTAGTALNFASKVDAAGVSRYTSGGSTITPVNVNIDSGNASAAQVFAGAIVAAAASASARLLDHILIRPVIPVVNDSYVINFGQVDPSIGALIPSGTANAQQQFSTSPVVIGPQETWLGHLWLPSQSAASSYEFTLCYVERTAG